MSQLKKNYNPDRTILILDEDPYKAAKCLIKAHVVFYIPMLQNIFAKYHDVNFNIVHSHTYTWIHYMRRSKQNYAWTVKFYKTLQEIFRTKISFNSSYYNNTDIPFSEDYLEVPTDLNNGRHEICLPPSHMNKHTKNIVRFKELKEKQVISNRIQYLIMNYSDHLFPGRVLPEWYNRVKNTFEYLNVIDNALVRLVRNNMGSYKYFCKVGASDTWIEIKNVPEHMKYIINALMYTCEGTNKHVVEKRFKNTLMDMEDVLDGNCNSLY